MADLFENFIAGVDPIVAYFFLFISAFFENVLPPIPGDTVVVIGAYLVTTGQLDFWGVYISTTLGSVAGFFTMYLAGLRYGRPFIYKKSRRKIFKPEQIKKVEVWFGKWGYWVIFANRFLSGTRSVISLFAGMFHLNGWYVMALALISALIWNALLISGGLLLGRNWHRITEIIAQYNRYFLIALAVLVIYWLVRRYRAKNKMENNIE